MMTRFEATTIRGAGFALRPLEAGDVPTITEACADELTLRWLPLPRPYTAQDATAFVERIAPASLADNSGVVFAIDEGDGIVGCIDLKRTDWAARTTETGYWVAPWARGRGVATRATRRLAEWALREKGFERVELRAAPGNAASAAVARKAGFVAEGTARNAGHVHGGRCDLDVFSLVPADLR